MPLTKNQRQKFNRRMNRIRATLNDGRPMSILPSAMSAIDSAVDSNSWDQVSAALSFGRDAESITKIVNGIAVIPVVGVLRDSVDFMVRIGLASSYQLIERDFKQAIGNSQIRGVMFYFDSPGGSAIGCKRVADLVFEARGEKSIRSYVQGVCASAAYYIAGATDQIHATADSLVASIGTIFPHQEIADALEEFGVGVTVLTNKDSPKKGHGNIYEKLSDEARETLQGFVDSYGRPFVEDVARYRGVTPEEVVASFGQGDAIRASVAIESGIVDSLVADFDEALESISSVSSGSTPVEEDDD